MKCFHIHVGVEDFDRSIRLHSNLFAVDGPPAAAGCSA
jgi:hypothetical protein